jgi:pyridoxine kinase
MSDDDKKGERARDGEGKREVSRSRSRRVLSIQSNVVYGYVGNKCSVFALQALGVEVDPLNTVQLSNHTGYQIARGTKFPAQNLLDSIAGLKANGFLQQYTDLITGYVGSVDYLKALARVIAELQQVQVAAHGEKLCYVCDPVMGDDGRMYTPSEFVEIYRDSIIPHATIITPNQTEAELLSGIAIATADDLRRVCRHFHDRGIECVFITSCTLRGVEDGISVFASRRTNGNDSVPSSSSPSSSSSQGVDVVQGGGEDETCYLCVPRVRGKYSGTGDLTTALFAAWFSRSGGDLAATVINCMTTVYAIVRDTEKAQSKEILLLKGRDYIEHPPAELADAWEKTMPE